MSEFELDVVVTHDSVEPLELGSVKKKGLLRKILNGEGQNGKKSYGFFATDVERRTIADRLLRVNFGKIEKLIIPDDEEEREHGSLRKSGPLLSGTAYCISSCGMILLNKVVLSTYNFDAEISLLFYQSLISCLVVAGLGLCRVVSVEKMNWRLIRTWIPVNLIFIGMLVSSMYSLKYMNIAMVSILKNVTNILTAIGEFYIFRKRQNQKVWTAMFLMIISAITGGITDLSFDALGYTWQFLNCILTASYSLTLRRVMDKGKQATKTGSLNEMSMVLLNNLLSLPLSVLLILLFDEWDYVVNVDVIRLPMFWIAATASGLLGLAISFTSVWFLHQTGPTTYSLVGSLNKIPISMAGLVLFNVPLSLPNLFSILFGLFAGVFFAKAKMSSSSHDWNFKKEAAYFGLEVCHLASTANGEINGEIRGLV